MDIPVNAVTEAPKMEFGLGQADGASWCKVNGFWCWSAVTTPASAACESGIAACIKWIWQYWNLNLMLTLSQFTIAIALLLLAGLSPIDRGALDALLLFVFVSSATMNMNW